MSYTTGQIAGTYDKPDGSPQEGSAVVIPSVPLVRDPVGNKVIVGRLTVPLVNGAFTVTVPASDDATLDPTGVTYTVALRFKSSHPKAVVGVFVPGGATVQMADVTSVDPDGPAYALQVTHEDLSALAGTVATLPRTADVAAAQAAANAHTDTALAALAPVATAGTYASLTGKPTIPADLSSAVATLQTDVAALKQYTIALDTDGAPYLVIGA